MDEKKNTQNTSSTKTPVTINAMSKMMAMQASLPELIFNLKLMGVNVGGSIINPFIAMTFVQAIETAVENTGSEDVVNKFNTAVMLSGSKDGKGIDPMMMMLMNGNKDIDPMMFMLMNNKDGDKSKLLPFLMMKDNAAFKDNPMLMMSLMGGKDIDPMMLMMMNNKDGKIDPMTMMMLSGKKDIDPMMFMLMNNKDGDNNMLPLLMMNGGLDKFKDNPMMLSMLLGGKMDSQTLMMMSMMKGKDGSAKVGLF